MFVRMASAVTTGTFITLGLFYVMQGLIAMQPGAASDPIGTGTLEFVRIPPREELRTFEEPPPDKDFIDPPDLPDTRLESDVLDVVTIPSEGPPAPRGGGDIPFGIHMDGPLVAIVRVAPEFPPSMAARGIEGWVTVQFDVTAQGTVVNPVVIASSNSGFHRAAINAASKFRYKARVVNGIPIETTGVQNRFVFNLTD